MRASVQELLDSYQIRKSVKQKRALIAWLDGHAKAHGYLLTKQRYKGGLGCNLIVGSPKTAKVILSAHYDTATSALLPIVAIVGNFRVYVLSQICTFLPAIVLLWGLYEGAVFLFEGAWLVEEMVSFIWFEVPLLFLIFLNMWIIQRLVGFANRRNANDNTSGMAVLLALLEDLPTELRPLVCFVFFDEEEKGLKGAKSFKRHYQKAISATPIINFDCVAHGQQLLFIAKQKFIDSDFHEVLADVIADEALIVDAKNHIYPSDQRVFKNSVAVVALHKMPIMGYYLSRLHSRLDVKFNAKNVEALAKMMIEFVEKIARAM